MYQLMQPSLSMHRDVIARQVRVVLAGGKMLRLCLVVLACVGIAGAQAQGEPGFDVSFSELLCAAAHDACLLAVSLISLFSVCCCQQRNCQICSVHSAQSAASKAVSCTVQ
jgi:hypothetical protein